MKAPKPFFRGQKGAWVVQLRDGRQKSLGKHPEGLPPPRKDKRGRWNPPEEILREYHRLMLHEEGAAPRRKSYSVAEVFDLYLEYCKEETSSFELYNYFLNDAAKSFGRLGAGELEPFHVNRWLKAHPSWGPTTRHMVLAVVKAAFNYAVGEGYIDLNPVRNIRMPTPEARDRVLTPEERGQIFGGVSGPLHAVVSYNRRSVCAEAPEVRRPPRFAGIACGSRGLVQWA